MEYYKQLDGLRFLAIFMVAIAHYVQWQVGNVVAINIPFVYGVTLFFVLSGFLITRILLQHKNQGIGKSLKVFYGRRAVRIFPLYFVTIGIVFFMGYTQYRELIPWLLSYSINIYHSINPQIDLGDFSHLWSLAVEEQFYLIWPIFVLTIPLKYFLKLASGLIVISLLYKTLMLSYFGNWAEADSGFFSNFYSLGVGGVIGYLSIYSKTWFASLADTRLLGALFFVCVLTVLYRVFFPEDVFFKVVVMQLIWVFFFAVLIVKVTFNPKGLYQLVLQNPIVSYLGKISYGIYMIHLFIPSLFYYWDPNSIFIENKYIGFVGFFGFTILLASISWFTIEKWFLK
ncbi:MAG: acyltransferase family protein, partial [Salibacteraceae bacterium]